MTEKEKRDQGLLYLSMDEQLTAERQRAKSLIFQFNNLPPTEVEAKKALLRELFGKTGKDFWVEAPFY